MANWEKLIEEHYEKKNKIDFKDFYQLIDEALARETNYQGSGAIEGHAGKRLSTKGNKKAGGDPFDEDPPKERSKSAPAGFGVLQEEEVEELFALGLLEEDFLEESWQDIYKKARAENEWTKMGPNNFPYEGNEEWGGLESKRKPWVMYDVTFPVHSATKIYTLPDRELLDVPKGSEVKFLEPYKMYQSVVLAAKVSKELGTEVTPKTFGVTSKQGVALVQLKSGEKGYIPFTKVAKPGGGTQSRVAAGSQSQDAVMGVIEKLASEKNVSAAKIDSAPPGSTRPDLVVNYAGKQIQFEIKGRKTRGGVISFFDKSARRGGNNETLDIAAKAFVKGISVEFFPEGAGNGDKQSANLGSAMKSTGFSTSDSGLFERAIDFFKKHVDPRIGFCGDPSPTPKSGAMPPQFNTQDSGILTMIRNNILAHLASGGDNYFAVYTESEEDAELYSTGFGKNPIGSNDFPDLAQGRLATYGGCSSGATRVGFKAALKSQGDGLSNAEPPKSEPEN